MLVLGLRLLAVIKNEVLLFVVLVVVIILVLDGVVELSWVVVVNVALVIVDRVEVEYRVVGIG